LTDADALPDYDGGGTGERSSGEVDLTERRDELLLAQRVRLGDAVAFEAVFRRYHRELRESARRVVGSRVMAEDVVQDVFLALWTARERLRIGTSLGAYLHRSVRNAAIRRSTRRVERAVSLDELHDTDRPPRQPFVAPDPSPLDHAEHSLLVDDLARAAATLPPRAREVFTLSRRDQLTTREIATRLSLSPKTVEMHLTRALTALRGVLGRGGGGGGGGEARKQKAESRKQ
jgi:RNA polymerase sigma-70 factor (ECF subfamily)